MFVEMLGKGVNVVTKQASVKFQVVGIIGPMGDQIVIPFKALVAAIPARNASQFLSSLVAPMGIL